jgi:hypothetical protein
VERDVHRQGESTERLYLSIKNEAELAGLKEPDEDSKTLLALVHFSRESYCYRSMQARDVVISSLCNI